MKQLLIILFVSMQSAAVAQWNNMKKEWGVGYVYTAPQHAMQHYVKQAHGVHLDLYVTPKEKPFSVGIEMSFNSYGHDKSRQNYVLGDGTSAPMDIIVSNDFINVLLGGRYYLRKGNIEPYVSGKIGYAMFSTNLNIYDPNDRDHCEPLDTELLHHDGAVVAGVGGGLRVDVSPNKNPGKFYINASANYLTGGKVTYMNVDAPDMAQHGTTPTSDVYTKFLNTQTQVVHEHHVGNIYSSMIHLIDFRLGLTIKWSY